MGKVKHKEIDFDIAVSSQVLMAQRLTQKTQSRQHRKLSPTNVDLYLSYEKCQGKPEGCELHGKTIDWSVSGAFIMRWSFI